MESCCFAPQDDQDTVNLSEAVESNSNLEDASAHDFSQDEMPEGSVNTQQHGTGESTYWTKSKHRNRSERLASFNDWPESCPIKPKDLAEAGFVYEGHGDSARCFHCGTKVNNWTEKGNVWEEHARWSPGCAFLLEQVGKDFVDSVQATARETDENACAADAVQAMQDPVTPLPLGFEEDPAVLTLCDFGFNKGLISDLAWELHKAGVPMTSVTLYTAALARGYGPTKNPINNFGNELVTVEGEGNETRNQARFLNEIDKLRQLQLCKICKVEDVGIVFFPCRHFVSCIGCSSTVPTCPVCGARIEGQQKASSP